MTTIVLTQKTWADIYNRIAQEYGPKYVLIRAVTKRELGFTPRTHVEWVPDQGPGSYDGLGEHVTSIHLDFYSEEHATLFRLKYL